jgi:hypothetical protein
MAHRNGVVQRVMDFQFKLLACTVPIAGEVESRKCLQDAGAAWYWGCSVCWLSLLRNHLVDWGIPEGDLKYPTFVANEDGSQNSVVFDNRSACMQELRLV